MPRFLHRWVPHLALLAIVLLATVPTLGRIAGAATASSVPQGAARMSGMDMHHAMPGMVHDMAAMPGDMAMHGMPPMHGHAMHQATASAAGPDIAAHDGAQGHDGDCDYCPLLHSLLGAFAIALLSTPGSALPVPRCPDIAAPARWHYPTGLGSRGPPAYA